MSVSVQTGSWRAPSEMRPSSVLIQIDGALANDLSALLLTLPAEQFERFKVLSEGLDRHIAGREFGRLQ